MVGLCNYVPTLILGGVQGLFAGFVQYVLGELLIVTSLVVGFLVYTLLELFCTVCNLLVIVNRVNTRWRCLDRIVVASEAIA